jgi:hypothetical protein
LARTGAPFATINSAIIREIAEMFIGICYRALSGSSFSSKSNGSSSCCACR